MRRIYHSLGKRGFASFIFLIVFIVFFYLPLANLVMLAFGNRYEVPAIFPQEFGVKWWEWVLNQRNLVSSITTSFILAVVVTGVSLLICLPAAYALARYEFKGRRIFMFSFLLTNAFPKIGLYVAIAIIYYRLGLMGTFMGVVIIHVLNSMVFMTWLPMNAFRAVHKQQEEAARDAGAGPFRTFLSITLPLAKPGIIVASLFTFMSSLEEAQGALLVGFPQVKTMPVELYGVIMQYPTTAGPVLSLILLFPTLLILLLGGNLMSDGMGSQLKVK